MRPRTLLILAVIIAGVHFTLRGVGAGVHTSIIVGMPQSEASWILGPAYALAWLALIIVAPVLTFAAGLELSIGQLHKWRT